LLGGVLKNDVPECVQPVYMDGHHAAMVAELNKVTASVVREAMDALAPYLK
jgi:hypothetical protein